jgi:hypothetical protein
MLAAAKKNDSRVSGEPAIRVEEVFMTRLTSAVALKGNGEVVK